jgi:2-aminoadipate transaminase
MQYGVSVRIYELHKNLLQSLWAKKGLVSKLMILITSGSQQGLDLTAKVFLDEGILFYAESPTYLSAFNAFNPFYPRYVEIENGEEV